MLSVARLTVPLSPATSKLRYPRLSGDALVRSFVPVP